jgi:diguanylate cyclase (GGDEF)-like protein
MGAGRYLEGVRKNGRDIPVEVGLSPIVIGGERLVLVSVVDMSDRYLANKLSRVNRTLKLEATHDDLTGLPNRRLFLELLEKSVNSAIRRGSRIALMYVDLDGFKKVNDENGHDVGDALLCEVASILSRNVRKGDIVARIGGDEFIISLIDTKDADSVIGVGKKLIKEISSVERIGDCQVNISASIGAFRTAMADSKSLEMLIKTADKLMYKAKRSGKGRIAFEEDHLPADDKHGNSIDSHHEVRTN